MKKELINELAQALDSYGYTVYIAKNGDYGFYTDGKRVVSFGGQWRFSIDYSGNYKSNKSGTGWGLEKDKGILTKEEADDFIKRNAPHWATNENVTYTSPEQHLKTYGSSSGYKQYLSNEIQ